MLHAQKWMPVFVVVEATKELRAAHPDEKATQAASTCPSVEDYWQRIGTAFLRQDGGLNVRLVAIPLNGKLVIRPPKDGERLDPTVTSE